MNQHHQHHHLQQQDHSQVDPALLQEQESMNMNAMSMNQYLPPITEMNPKWTSVKAETGEHSSTPSSPSSPVANLTGDHLPSVDAIFNPQGQHPRNHKNISPIDGAGGGPVKYRRYVCHCGKAFTTSGHLARHNRIHTGEKNFVCPYHECGARFSRQDNCNQHYRTHLNKKSHRRSSVKKQKLNSDDEGSSSPRSSSGDYNQAVGEYPTQPNGLDTLASVISSYASAPVSSFMV